MEIVDPGLEIVDPLVIQRYKQQGLGVARVETESDLTNCIELVSGEFFDYQHPERTRITPVDIAHGLANTCRFGGQSRTFYSVAEHACLVAWRLRQQNQGINTQWIGLHHDDAEAFMGDIPRPLKAFLPEYQVLETKVMQVICDQLALGFDPAEPHPVVKAADNWALAAEAYHLLPSKGLNWFCAGLYGPGEHVPWQLGSNPEGAESQWLHEHGKFSDWLGL